MELGIPPYKETKKTIVVDAGLVSETTLSDSILAITTNLSNPRLNRIEIPSTFPHYFSPLGLMALAKVRGLEINIVSARTESGIQTRAISGEASSCGTKSLLPAWYPDKSEGEPENLLKIRGYPIVDDFGHVPDAPWHVDLHNHPGDDEFPGHPYPSPGDLCSKADFCLIVSSEGLTQFEIPDLDQPPPDLPPHLAEKFKERTRRSILSSIGSFMAIAAYYQNILHPDDPRLETQGPINQYVCEIMGVKIKILRWDADAEAIQELCNHLNAS